MRDVASATIIGKKQIKSKQNLSLLFQVQTANVLTINSSNLFGKALKLVKKKTKKAAEKGLFCLTHILFLNQFLYGHVTYYTGS